MTQNSLLVLKFAVFKYRARNKGMHILLSNSQAGPGRTVKQEQEEISRNHVQAFIPGSVRTLHPRFLRKGKTPNKKSWVSLTLVMIS